MSLNECVAVAYSQSHTNTDTDTDRQSARRTRTWDACLVYMTLLNIIRIAFIFLRNIPARTFWRATMKKIDYEEKKKKRKGKERKKNENLYNENKMYFLPCAWRAMLRSWRVQKNTELYKLKRLHQFSILFDECYVPLDFSVWFPFHFYISPSPLLLLLFHHFLRSSSLSPSPSPAPSSSSWSSFYHLRILRSWSCISISFHWHSVSLSCFSIGIIFIFK